MTFYFTKPKILYIIVPGTGSNSFHPGLQQKYPNFERIEIKKDSELYKLSTVKHNAHWTARQVKAIMDPELWKNARKIGFIRNPFDWCNSIYNKGGIEVLNFDNKHGFTHFLETLDKTPYDWLTDENDNLVMDTVYKTEDLDPTIFKEYQIAVRYSNKSRKPRVEMSNKDIEIIREKFYREFKHYED